MAGPLEDRKDPAHALRPGPLHRRRHVHLRLGHQQLVDVQNSITEEQSRRWVGRRLEVLSEGPSKKDADVATTRTRGGKVVHVPGSIPAGTFLDVDVTASSMHHLTGVRA